MNLGHNVEIRSYRFGYRHTPLTESGHAGLGNAVHTIPITVITRPIECRPDLYLGGKRLVTECIEGGITD